MSLLAHALVFLLLLATLLRKAETPEQLPPPAPVAMVFESGRKQGPSVPNPSLETRPVAPPATQPGGEPQPPVLPPPPSPSAPTTPSQPTPQPPKPEAPPAQPPPPQPETPPPQPPPVQPPPPQPAPSPVTPPATTPTPPVAPSPEPAVPLPPPPPPPPPQQPRPQTQPRPQPRPETQPREAARPKAPPSSSGFPAPLDYSFNSPAARSPARPRPTGSSHRMGAIDMSLGPAIRGVLNNTPQGDDDDGGPDWRNALSQWVAEHAYYPMEARRDGDEGDARVHVVADHFGHVKEVQLIGKSGSIWLDTALVALFRDAHIPPLPTSGDDPIEFNFTMRYILVRPPGG